MRGSKNYFRVNTNLFPNPPHVSLDANDCSLKTYLCQCFTIAGVESMIVPLSMLVCFSCR